MKVHHLRIGRIRRKKERSHETAEYRLPHVPYIFWAKFWDKHPTHGGLILPGFDKYLQPYSGCFINEVIKKNMS